MKETLKKGMMHKKGKKCVLISKRGRKNVKSIKKPSVGNRDSYKNKDKMWRGVERHVSTLIGAKVENIEQFVFQNSSNVKYLTKDHDKEAQISNQGKTLFKRHTKSLGTSRNRFPKLGNK